MSSRGGSMRLCACLLNISEARDKKLVEQVALSALKVNNVSPETTSASPGNQNIDKQIKASVLNIFADHDYNRSVITIVAQAQDIASSVISACCTAYELIDLRRHHGGHPRLGAVDLVPIHPLSADVSLHKCGDIARDIACELTSAVPGTSAFLFGHADLPQHRGLVQRRKQMRWFAGRPGGRDAVMPDMGDGPTDRYGITGVGAIPYVTNCNVTIDTTDVAFGQEIASKIRATAPGGLPGVKSMAFEHDGKVEIACNVESFMAESELNKDAKPGVNKTLPLSDLICSFGMYYHVPGWVLEHRVKELAANRGVKTLGTALVGFTPEEAYARGVEALNNGRDQAWKDTTAIMM